MTYLSFSVPKMDARYSAIVEMKNLKICDNSYALINSKTSNNARERNIKKKRGSQLS